MSAPKRRPSTIDTMRRGFTAAAAAAPAAPAEPVVAAAESPRRPRPEKPVRFTLDLDWNHHQFLKAYAAEIEAKGASEVMRALLDELRADPELAARVRGRVWGGR